MTTPEALGPSKPIDRVLSACQGVTRGSSGWTALCPAHEDSSPSLSISEADDGKVLIHCLAGCAVKGVVAGLGLEMRDLFPTNGKGGPSRAGGGQELTVAELAADKNLPEEFLRSVGVAQEGPAVRVFYFLADGSLAPRHRIRTALKAKDGSRWTGRSGPVTPYGLWRLEQTREAGYLVLVEGESDSWTLWFHGLPALGIPGATMAKTLEAAHLDRLTRIYLFQEPDAGGEAFLSRTAARLAELHFSGSVRTITLPGFKDPNDLHKENPGEFKAVFQRALDEATDLSLPPAATQTDLHPGPEADTTRVEALLERATAVDPGDKSAIITLIREADGLPTLDRVQLLKAISKRTKTSRRDLEAALKEQGGTRARRQVFDLERGDDVELGRRLLQDLRPAEGPNLVFAEGSLLKYDKSVGIWDPIEDHDQERTVHGYAGLPVPGPGGSLRPLFLTRQRIAGILSCAATEATCPRFLEDPPHGINVRNGFLQISQEGAKLLPHSPDHRCLHGLPVDYDLEAEAPRLLQFLAEVFLEDDDAAEKAACLQEFLGACLIGQAPAYQQALVLYGPKAANGKSQVLEIATSLFPPRAIAHVPPQQWKHEYYRAALAGIRLNSVSELPEAGIVEAEWFKAIITGEPQGARQPYGRVFGFRPQAGHIFACNRLPVSDDLTQGFWRRCLVIQFNRVIPEGDRETDLGQAIVKAEMAGVVRWVIDGAIRLLRSGGQYTIPPSSIDAKNTWRRQADQVAQFIDEVTIPATDAERGTPASVLYTEYKVWADEAKHRPLTKNSFFQRLSLLGLEKRHTRAGQVYDVKLRDDQ